LLFSVDAADHARIDRRAMRVFIALNAYACVIPKTFTAKSTVVKLLVLIGNIADS
jgi:hypothetical protein